MKLICQPLAYFNQHLAGGWCWFWALAKAESSLRLDKTWNICMQNINHYQLSVPQLRNYIFLFMWKKGIFTRTSGNKQLGLHSLPKMWRTHAVLQKWTFKHTEGKSCKHRIQKRKYKLIITYCIYFFFHSSPQADQASRGAVPQYLNKLSSNHFVLLLLICLVSHC